mgnify:CR=1 FL=1
MNSSPAQVSQCHPGLWRRHAFSDSQDDPGGKQRCFRRNFEEGPTPIPSCLCEGGGDQRLVWGPEGIEDGISKNSTPEAVGRGPKEGGRPQQAEGEGEESRSQRSYWDWWHYWRNSECQWNYSWASWRNWTCWKCWKYWVISECRWDFFFPLELKKLMRLPI